MGIVVNVPPHLWLLEAYTNFRLETGASRELAILALSDMYPTYKIERVLLKTAQELLDAMAPVYAQRYAIHMNLEKLKPH